MEDSRKDKMYKFRDTVKRKHYHDIPFIPTSAMLYDTSYLEEVIEGYQTLSVEGREMYSLEFETQDTQVGSVITNRKLPARVLTVKYKLEDKSPEILQEKFDTLKAFLIRDKDVHIRFKDDQDYYFVGRFQTADTVPGDTNSTVSTFTIYCQNPFKYGKEQTSTGKIISELPYAVKPDIFEIKMLGNQLNATDGNYHLKVSSAVKGDLLRFDFQRGEVYLNNKKSDNILDLDSDFKNIRLNTGCDFSGSNYELKITYRKAVL